MKRKQLLSLKANPNAQTTAHIEQAQVATNEPTQETKMEVSNNPPEANELTAKQMAEAEEANLARAKQIIQHQQQKLERTMREEPSILDLAERGRDALEDHLRKHAAEEALPTHIPPPRTARQMSALEEELEAGRRAQQKAQAALNARPAPEPDVNEGFTTPVHRPGDFVPDVYSKDPAIQ